MICDECGRGMMLGRNRKYECVCGHVQGDTDNDDDLPSVDDEIKRITAEGKEKKRTLGTLRAFRKQIDATIDKVEKDLEELTVQYRELKR
jgi:septal ring factor EnvC (AmiA/AmiB activator)